MGMISKAVRGKQNQKFAEKIRVATPLSINEVVEAAKALCDEHNAGLEELHQRARTGAEQGGRMQRWAASKMSEHAAKEYYYEVTPERVLIGWKGVPSKILAITKPSMTAKYWLAAITFPSVEASPEFPNGEHVDVALVKWVIDSEGRLQSKDQYEKFCDDFFTRITKAQA